MSDEQKALSTDNVDHRFLEPGRICQIVWGKNYRKLVCLVDFIDSSRVLVDGAMGKLSDIKRVSMPMRWIQVTKFKIKLDRCASSAETAKVVEETDVVNVLYAQKRKRQHTHPVLRRVVGSFRKTLKSRIQKKEMATKRRLRKQKIYFTK